ncbi:hypothetical protein Trydic_g9330 [Trypoxylus dichotomus]
MHTVTAQHSATTAANDDIENNTGKAHHGSLRFMDSRLDGQLYRITSLLAREGDKLEEEELFHQERRNTAERKRQKG